MAAITYGRFVREKSHEGYEKLAPGVDANRIRVLFA